MAQSQVLSLYISPERRKPMVEVKEIHAVESCGIDGDRFFRDTASGKTESPSSQITLIESEALEALKRVYEVELAPEETRRNVVTQGVPLNHLVNREFQVGDAVLKGIKLCEPCDHLEGMTRPGIKKGLIHRGGLRAQIIKSGMIKAGDQVVF